MCGFPPKMQEARLASRLAGFGFALRVLLPFATSIPPSDEDDEPKDDDDQDEDAESDEDRRGGRRARRELGHLCRRR
jgi:hypothetical protein